MTDVRTPPALAEGLVRPMMRPRVVNADRPALVYVDPNGRHVALDLSDLDLAHLALTVAETQAARARDHLRRAELFGA